MSWTSCSWKKPSRWKNIDTHTHTHATSKKGYENQMTEELDLVDSFEKNRKAKKRKFKEIDEKIVFYLDPRKT